jgi:hypothetical protein
LIELRVNNEKLIEISSHIFKKIMVFYIILANQLGLWCAPFHFDVDFDGIWSSRFQAISFEVRSIVVVGVEPISPIFRQLLPIRISFLRLSAVFCFAKPQLPIDILVADNFETVGRGPRRANELPEINMNEYVLIEDGTHHWYPPMSRSSDLTGASFVAVEMSNWIVPRNIRVAVVVSLISEMIFYSIFEY